MDNKSGFLDDLSQQQEEVLLQVKNHIRIKLKVTDERWNDWYVLRFCRARKFDYPKVILMIENFLAWAQTQNLNNVGQLDLSKYQRLREWYAHGYYNTDKIGRPIYIEQVRKLKINDVTQNYADEEIMLYYLQSYERLIHIIFPECSRVAGKRIEQTCTIMDLKDVNTLKLLGGKVKAFLKIATTIGQDYYPEILGSMYIINAGLLFSACWTLVKPWIDPKTQQKIHIISGSGKKDLALVVEAHNLPDWLGGTCTNELTEDMGPWKEELVLSQKNRTVRHHDQALVDHYYLSAREKEEKKHKLQITNQQNQIITTNMPTAPSYPK